jgi:hypothetical protein
MLESRAGHEQFKAILDTVVNRDIPAHDRSVTHDDLPYRILFSSFDECVGEVREDFFALAMEQHGVPFSYAKTNRGVKTPDFVVDEGGRTVILEVGGKGKGRTRFKGLDYDVKIVLAHATDVAPEAGKRLPLHCIGFPP